MRTQHRNKSPIFYSNFAGKNPVVIEDEYGNRIETGETEIVYTDPVRMMANVSPARGESATRQFGEAVDYDKIIVLAGRSPVSETSILWIDNLDADGEIPLTDGERIPHDYVVTKIAQSLNSVSIAVRKVSVS